MSSIDKLFTLDDVLYYLKFATTLHCDEALSKQILKSLIEDMTTQNIVSKEVMAAALTRNGISTGDIVCGACGTAHLKDTLKQCPSCKRLVHTLCFWKPFKFCNRECERNSVKG